MAFLKASVGPTNFWVKATVLEARYSSQVQLLYDYVPGDGKPRVCHCSSGAVRFYESLCCLYCTGLLGLGWQWSELWHWGSSAATTDCREWHDSRREVLREQVERRKPLALSDRNRRRDETATCLTSYHRVLSHCVSDTMGFTIMQYDKSATSACSMRTRHTNNWILLYSTRAPSPGQSIAWDKEFPPSWKIKRWKNKGQHKAMPLFCLFTKSLKTYILLDLFILLVLHVVLVCLCSPCARAAACPGNSKLSPHSLRCLPLLGPGSVPSRVALAATKNIRGKCRKTGSTNVYIMIYIYTCIYIYIHIKYMKHIWHIHMWYMVPPKVA